MNVIETTIGTAGFMGCAYVPEPAPRRAVIVVTGSDGGIENARYIARLYAREGLLGLAVGYWGAPGLRRHLSEVPLEYIENAARWLKRYGGGRIEEIGGYGLSKGAEYMLVASAFFPDIRAVAAMAPGYFVAEGLQKSFPPYTGKSSWTYRGRSLPFTPLGRDYGQFLAQSAHERQLCMGVFYKGAHVLPQSLIPLEKGRARILLCSAGEDSMWPSRAAAQKLFQRLEEAGHPYACRHICFERASHLLSPMPQGKDRLLGVAMRAERHHPRECANARAEAFKTSVEWFTQ